MCKAHYCAEHGRLRQITSSCECALSAHSAFYVIGNSNRISYYIKNPLMSRSLIRGKIHSCLCYDERRCKAHYCAEHGRLRQITSSCECALSAHSAFYVIGNSNRISYYIKNPLMSRSLIRGKIHSCLCYDERRENSPIIKIIDEFNMKKNNLVKSICNGVFKIAYCI